LNHINLPQLIATWMLTRPSHPFPRHVAPNDVATHAATNLFTIPPLVLNANNHHVAALDTYFFTYAITTK
jgi:hypothetical protein